MVNEEIVGGIKNALERGDSLRNAMMSFFNAGYDRKEIEEAAATLLNYQPAKSETTVPIPMTKNVEIKKEISAPKNIQKVSSYGEDVEVTPTRIASSKTVSQEMPSPVPKVIINEEQKFIPKELPRTIINAMPQTNAKKMEKPIQKVSSSAMTPQEKVIIAILVGLLIFLIGLLVVIFLFRQQLIDFISSLVS
ncbi:MAG: hypothetical protein WC511_05185 [Candidatus Pacearchaeota archaeon]